MVTGTIQSHDPVWKVDLMNPMTKDKYLLTQDAQGGKLTFAPIS
jgi:hypothetical protein